MSLGPQGVDLVQQLCVLTTGDEGQPLDGRSWGADELHDLLDERGGEVVDDVPTEVLEHGGSHGAARS